MKNILPKLIQDDKWLEPYSETIIKRIEEADKKEKEITVISLLWILHRDISILVCTKPTMAG